MVINDTSQRSVAAWFRCRDGGTFDQYFTTNLLRSLFWENLFKIAQHLAKLWGI